MPVNSKFVGLIRLVEEDGMVFAFHGWKPSPVQTPDKEGKSHYSGKTRG
jgi:hypothetical protein